jgi:hypothetical protein
MTFSVLTFSMASYEHLRRSLLERVTSAGGAGTSAHAVGYLKPQDAFICTSAATSFMWMSSRRNKGIIEKAIVLKLKSFSPLATVL